MKITKSQLKQIIKEELESVLSEQHNPHARDLAAAYYDKEDDPSEKGSYWEATAMQNVSKGAVIASDADNIKKVAEQMAGVHGFPSKSGRMPYVDPKTGEKKVHQPKPLLHWKLFKERAIYYIMYTGSLEFDSKLEEKYLLTRRDYPEIGAVKKKPLPKLSKDIKPFSSKDQRTHQQRLHQQYLERD